MSNLPEKQVYANIDATLAAGGWAVQEYKDFNPSASTGLALCEVPLKTGCSDYILLVNRKPVGVVEAKKEGVTLSTVAEQSAQTNLASISMSKLKSLAVPIPPLSEQVRIVAEVERRLSVVEELEAAVTTNLQCATRLRQTILQKAFAGGLH